MALQGTLDTFSLPDVLRLLATTSKTGRLRIDGDRGQGSVWLADGGVVDAAAERAVEGTPTDEVVFELLRFSAGSFAFDGDDTASAGREPEDVEGLLRRANSLLSEWTELEAVVPSLEHHVSLAGDLSVDEVTIDADRWRSLVAVASGRTVGELATTLGLTELGVSRAVRDLVDLGVAEIEAPGASTVAPHAPQPSSRDMLRRPSTRPEPDGFAARRIPGPSTAETRRAGWLTGDVPAVSAEGRPPSPGNVPSRASLDDDTVASPLPAPSPPPSSKGNFASRLGRSRNASADTGATPAARDTDQPTTGSTPTTVNGGSRSTGRTPRLPSEPTGEPGSRSRQGGLDAGSGGRREPDGSRSTSPESPSRAPSSPRPAANRPTRPPSSSGLGSPSLGGPRGSSPFEGGRLGPSPSARDTGQIRPVTPSSLPPDLHWAADDTSGGGTTGPTTSPFVGLSSLGPSPAPSQPAPDKGEIAPHVAAMSPDARSAVQSTVGNAGGSTGGRGGPQGEDIAQRGRLISFLSTVR